MVGVDEQRSLLRPRDQNAMLSQCRHKQGRRWERFIWTAVGALTTLMLTIVVVLSIIAAKASGDTTSEIKQSLGIDLPRDTQRPGFNYTKYMSTNETEAAQAWDKIEPGHGIVAVTREWAEGRGLPPSHEHPLRNGQLVYGIEAYHAMHCLRNIRRHYFNLKHGESFDRPEEHDLHCFDALRQYIMCTADENLLATTGHNDLGRNQLRVCKNWDKLREWATERTACYHDYEPTPEEGDWPRWRNCKQNLSDGLPIGSILE